MDIVADDPADSSETPQAIVDEATLTRTEKRQLIEEWALGRGQRTTAAEKGMAPADSAIQERDARTSVALAAAREALESSIDQKVELLPARLWKRLTKAN